MTTVYPATGFVKFAMVRFTPPDTAIVASALVSALRCDRDPVEALVIFHDDLTLVIVMG